MYQIAKELAKKLGLDISDLETPHLSDTGNAKMLRILHGENLRYCWPWKCWLVWDDTRWKQDKAGRIVIPSSDLASSTMSLMARSDSQLFAHFA